MLGKHRMNRVPTKLHENRFASRAGALAVMALLVAAASADFNVQPMMVTLNPMAGKRAMQLITCVNPSPDREAIISLFVTELSQNRDGSWLVIEQSDIDSGNLPPDVNLAGLASCRDWITIPKNIVKVPPLGRTPVLITMRVPPRIRGFYAAGVMVQEITPTDMPGVALSMRYLVPVLVTIQGRAAPSDVDLFDLSMRPVPASLEGPATTLLSLHVRNSGVTYGSIEGVIKLMAYTSGHWWKVTEQDYDELGIFPKITLVLDKDIQRPLPSGVYRIVGGVRVDGTRQRAIGKDVQFVGDATATKAALDMKLDLVPGDLIIDGKPGYARSKSYRVTNPGGDALTVKSFLSVPKVLGNTIGNVRGTELSCVPWLEVTPAEFTLRGRGSRTVRVTARMPDVPDPTSLYANYYAQLNLQCSYEEDGLTAGLTSTNVSVANEAVQGKPTGVAMSVSPKDAGAKSTYIVVAGFVNNGSVHFTPRCSAELSTAQGSQVVRKLLDGKTTIMLPFESRTFSAVFDLSSVEDGNYRMVATMQYGGAMPALKAVPVSVKTDGDRKILTVIGRVDFERQTGAQW